MNQLFKIYNSLLKKYGPQGWWPLFDLHISNNGVNPTKTGSLKGYHPGDYSYPKTNDQQFEIVISTILTQNTSWKNVEKALANLQKENLLSPFALQSCSLPKLKQLIKPVGYFNQKANYLKEITKFYISLNGKVPKREELLNIKGVGPETCDSILLYAYKQPFFVIDSYTKRILYNLKIISKKQKYEDIQKLFQDNLPKDYKLYQEFHALIVEHAKQFYTNGKDGKTDFLLKL